MYENIVAYRLLTEPVYPMRQRLTPNFVKEAPLPEKGDRVIYWEERQPGFGLMVTATGARSFVFQYRNAHGISRRWTWSTDLPLLRARSEAKKIAGRVEEGEDPVAQRSKEKEAAREAISNTLEAIAELYFASERRKPAEDQLRSLDKKHKIFKRNIYPHLGKRPIGEIKKSNINRMLTKLAERGPTAADEALTHLTGLFTWYAKQDDDFRNPIGRGSIDRRRVAGGCDRVLEDDELRFVWRTAEVTPGPFSAYVRFLLLTAVRRKEASGMRWDEVVDGLWTVPKQRMKGRTRKVYDHVVPLSPAAKAIIDDLPNLGPCVFTHNGEKPIAGFSMSKAKFDAAVLAELRKQDPEAKPLPNWTIHDLRRTARTLMSRAKVAPDIAERVTAHKIGGIRGVYDRYEYLDEKRDALEKLAKLIGIIITPPADNVTSLDDRRIRDSGHRAG